MISSPLAVLGLGFVLGLRHALDVDHLAAVSTMLSQRRGVARATLTGAFWGLGHTASLFVMALVVIGLHREISPATAHLLEFGVAVMLVALGLNLLRTLHRGGHFHLHVHDHAGHMHTHPHLHGHRPDDTPDTHHGLGGGRPFLVGMVHGLAGSAALMLAVLATIPSQALAVVYVLVFGVGSIGGMMAMSMLIGLPMALAQERFAVSERAVRTCAAVGSVVIGAQLAWQIGLDAGILS